MGTKPSESVEAKEVIVRGEVLRQLYNVMMKALPNAYEYTEYLTDLGPHCNSILQFLKLDISKSKTCFVNHVPRSFR